MRLPNAQKWCKDSVAKVTKTPFQLHVDLGPEVIFREKKVEGEAVAAKEPAVVRRVYTRRADYEQFGFTSGCPCCEHEMKYGPGRTTRPHSERCRARIMDELAKTESGRARLGFAADRMDRALAEHLEQNDARQALAQGENVEDVRDVPVPTSAEDPFQTFAPLDVEPLQLEARDAGSLPASFHEPMVLPDEVPLPEPVIVAPGLAANNGGMDVVRHGFGYKRPFWVSPQPSTSPTLT